MNKDYRRMRAELRACVRALGGDRRTARRQPRELSFTLWTAAYDARQRGQAELAALCSALFEVARLVARPPAAWQRAEFTAAAAPASVAADRYHAAQRRTCFSGAAGPGDLVWAAWRAVGAAQAYSYRRGVMVAVALRAAAARAG